MDKLQIKILDRNFSLITDEDPEHLASVAGELEKRVREFKARMRGKSEAEVLTLVAFDISDNADKETTELKRQVNVLRKRLEETEIKNKQLLIENMNSAESELVQIAVVKEHENNELRAKLREYEQQVEEVSTARDEEVRKLRETLVNYEKSFNDHAEHKEREILALQAEIEETRAENDGLKQRLAALDDDGQLTIC